MPKRTGPLGSIYFFLRPRRSLVRGVCWLISILHLNYRLLEQAENKRNCSCTKMCILWNTPTSQMFNRRRLEKQFFFHHHNVAYIMQSSSCDLSFCTFPSRKYCPQWVEDFAMRRAGSASRDQKQMHVSQDEGDEVTHSLGGTAFCFLESRACHGMHDSVLRVYSPVTNESRLIWQWLCGLLAF